MIHESRSISLTSVLKNTDISLLPFNYFHNFDYIINILLNVVDCELKCITFLKIHILFYKQSFEINDVARIMQQNLLKQILM